MQVIKKNNSIEKWDNNNIIEAINKSANRVGFTLSKEDAFKVANSIYNDLLQQGEDVITTKELHSLVINKLKEYSLEIVANSYREFRDYKNTYSKSWEEIKDESDRILFLGDNENANFDSSLISTKRSLIQGALTKELYKQFYLNPLEKSYIKRGDIYIHDLRDMMLNSINCCLFDIGNVLKNGFTMCNVQYTEPKSVLSALQVIGDITLVASAQQFGGFTLAEIDKVLLPYCEKTWNNAYNEAIKIFKCNQEDAEYYAINTLEKELMQGFQSLELKLNTVPSSRGDFAFTTLTFGQWDINTSTRDKILLNTICYAILDTRMKGHGGKPVVFPKLVYLYDENLIKNDINAQVVFEKCIECSSKNMYPDYLSLTGSPNINTVAKEYLDTGKIISPMGA